MEVIIANRCGALFTVLGERILYLKRNDHERYRSEMLDLAQETAVYHEHFREEDQGRTVAHFESEDMWDRIMQEFQYYFMRFVYFLSRIGVPNADIVYTIDSRIQFNIRRA